MADFFLLNLQIAEQILYKRPNKNSTNDRIKYHQITEK